MDVGEMNLDDARIGAADRICKGDRGMAIGTGIQDDRFAGPAGVLNPGDEIALLVRLAEM